LQTKVVDLLDTNFNSLTEMIENKFKEMRESHQKDKEEIIQAIQNERATFAKDAQIKELTLKEGELRGKDEVITLLNRNIETLKQQIDALRECHNHENPLQRVVDELTAKNLELQVSLKSLQEKAEKELQLIKA
jgi:predicted RNase H-like nuclease (RuvC/YqgF family)